MHSGHLGGGMSTVEEEGVSGLPDPHLALLVDRVLLGCGEEGGSHVQQPDTVQWSGPWTALSWPWMREAQMGRPYVFPTSLSYLPAWAQLWLLPMLSASGNLPPSEPLKPRGREVEVLGEGMRAQPTPCCQRVAVSWGLSAPNQKTDKMALR